MSTLNDEDFFAQVVSDYANVIPSVTRILKLVEFSFFQK